MIEENKTPEEVNENVNTWTPFTPVTAPDGQVLIDKDGLPPMRTKQDRVNWDYVISLDTGIGSPLPDWNERNNQETEV